MNAEPFSYARTSPGSTRKTVSDWRRQAACLGMDPDLFDQEDGERPDPEALETCRECPVRLDCLTEALQRVTAEDSGIWGGTTPVQRQVIRRGKRGLERCVQPRCVRVTRGTWCEVHVQALKGSVA